MVAHLHDSTLSEVQYLHSKVVLLYVQVLIEHALIRMLYISKLNLSNNSLLFLSDRRG